MKHVVKRIHFVQNLTMPAKDVSSLQGLAS